MNLDIAILILWFISLISAICNYATWASYKDSPDYYYNDCKNGWWWAFWTSIMIATTYYLEVVIK